VFARHSAKTLSFYQLIVEAVSIILKGSKGIFLPNLEDLGSYLKL
jgi:hypothetical protein